jgi:hypothetical protein
MLHWREDRSKLTPDPLWLARSTNLKRQCRFCDAESRSPSEQSSDLAILTGTIYRDGFCFKKRILTDSLIPAVSQPSRIVQFASANAPLAGSFLFATHIRSTVCRQDHDNRSQDTLCLTLGLFTDLLVQVSNTAPNKPEAFTVDEWDNIASFYEHGRLAGPYRRIAGRHPRKTRHQSQDRRKAGTL